MTGKQLDELILQLKIQNQILSATSLNYIIQLTDGITDEDIDALKRDACRLLNGRLYIDYGEYDHETYKKLENICEKYTINFEDLPEVLEEYITLDNEEYEEKLKETI